MANTNLLIQEVSITDKAVIFEGIDADALILADDLFRDFSEEPVVKFSFDRSNQGHMKYLGKIVMNARACKAETSFGKKIEALKDTYLLINDNFKLAE